ncbi:hypothetical protein EYZ11_000966 [Aspergillus tanneri]|uniref:Trafficking PGA2 n=1 Tax=Aspergillus tanneri TaxID=1220188 RepID=A0A4S3JW00_9EURO|nr:uncharacterized protein ATNIH1004_000230 [Aspergillus tanneri]KAA8651348.1 hypothetical protein ATNIH1004_000230 [Aspergillus tanneri]THC99597.1 hypothetical protein EYZ11_000966 [Aspergillus tanneri]
MPASDPSEFVADALNDFFGQLYTFFDTIFRRFFGNLYASFADVSVNRWTKVILSVTGYIIIRPYIEKFFAKMQERDRKKAEEKKWAQAEATGASGDKKAKVSANSLRAGGKVLGEVENTDDELDDGEDFATASGVPELGKNARKRLKKNMKKEAGQRTHNLSDEQLMELLDWSESEDEKKSAEKKADGETKKEGGSISS